jgi:transposase
MLFVGDDWAENHHDVYLMNGSGDRLASHRLPEGLAGIGRLHELVAAHTEDPAWVVIGIETDRGLWVDALTAAGYQVFAINPLAAARYRDRHHVSGAKSDPADAKLPADLVRTDRHNHRGIAGDSADATAIKVLARAHQNLIWARTRHSKGLRSALREYYPAALEAFEDLADRDALAILGRAPTPADAGRLSLSKIRAALKAAGRQRNLDTRALQIQATLRAPQLAAPEPVTAAQHPRPRWASSSNSTARSAISKPNWRHILKHTRTPTSTARCQDLVSSSAPGCSVNSGTTRTATPPPSLARTTPEPHH